MRPVQCAVLALLLCASAWAETSDLSPGDQAVEDSGDKVLFAGVTSLQFSATKSATSARGKRMPELRCVSGSAAGFWWHQDWYPRVASCVRYGGGDGGPSGAEWRCSATVRKHLVLGETNVICERYGDDAKYILAGSCRLEYALNFAYFQVRFVHVIYMSTLITALFAVYVLVRFRAMTNFRKLEAAYY